MTNSESDGRAAMLAGVGCYAVWGLVPLVFQLIGRLGPGPFEIVTHRIVWGALTALVLVLFARQGREVVAALKAPRTLGLLLLSAVLIAVNWGLFIWAVNSSRTLETSLGYYITPLISMAAGAAMFRERIDRTAVFAMGLALVGVVLQALALGRLPWVSLALALSFGGYGIVRKRVRAEAQPGLLIECLVLLIPSLAYIGWLQATGAGHFLSSPVTAAWLIASGPITAVPLALFAWAARRMPLSTLGFLQFLSPTLSFFIGAGEGESLTTLRAVSFIFIWAGAAVFAGGAWLAARRASRATEACVA